jgi:signal transduction histidine kinase/DNA-binding response OmpR family regulator
VDSSLLDTPLAWKIWQMGASEIYLNGKLIQKLGVVSPDDEREVLFNPKENPYAFQFKGSTHQVLAIRYSFTKSNPYMNFFAFGNPCLNIQVTRMEDAIGKLLYDKSYKAFIEFGKVGFLLFLGLLHLFFYLSYPKQRTNLYYSLFLLTQAVGYFLAYFGFLPTGESTFLLHFSHNILWLTFLTWGNLAVYSYARQSRDTFFWMVVWGMLPVLLLSRWPYSWGGYFFPVYVGLAILNATRVSARGIKNNIPGSKLVFAGWLIYLVCFSLTYLLIYHVIGIPFSLNRVFLIDSIFHIGVIAEALPFSILLAMEYARTNRSLQASLIESELRRLEAEKMHELDKMKSHFFANLSHEFRTPLTLITGSVENLSNQEKVTAGQQAHYQLIHRNAERLLELINQLLDLSKLEAGKLQLHKQPGEVIASLQVLASSFASLFESKRITYWYNLPFEPFYAHFDSDKLEKILTNLLSNALKFTPADGKVVVSAVVLPQNAFWRNLQITVQDTGIGIATEGLSRIFDRFYQADPSTTRVHEGTGIGLALVKELVELHAGTIKAESTPGAGTTFVVTLPLEVAQPVAKPEKEPASKLAKEPGGEYAAALADPTGEPMDKTLISYRISVLVVEDNREVRRLIQQSLSHYYEVVEAENGLEGYHKALDRIPDLIISDVMMPELDGVTLCGKLKADERTSHIPVILLTAKADIESKLTGLQTGADDYLTKPFRLEELQVRVKNLIEGRRKLRERYSRSVTLEPTDVAVTSTDEKFLQKALAVLESNLSDSTFDVATFSKEIGMSRAHLHRKLTALIDQSPSDFIRTIRLKRAARLLEQQAGNVSEVAFQVGFNSLTYFTKCFREYHGQTPSGYAGKNSSLNESKQ